ncbi:cytochrome p450 [Stemphylium lycopersici]|uniref:Cytochrome p450 n=1 Tax=Stemphylium lycopersici TaxID=183478 RepID=A0A364N613_STELY|nr:cytochrome p450 [Stemphylium lycopersici]RAR12775.1 cytochrome p450 [Stemphylium lycopersici]
MDALELLAVRLPALSPLAVNAASSFFGFLSIFLCYRALVAKQLRYQAWAYLFWGPEIIQKAFDEADGKPFELFAPDNRYVYVSDPKQIKEIDNAPDTVLSLQAASKQMLQPMYTMHGFNWFDRRGTEGVGFIRALRTLLTNNLPKILPDLTCIIRTRFQELHASHPVVNGKKQSDVYHMTVKLVVLSNAVSFFGKDLAKDEQFMVSALAYIEETLICAEIVRLLPSFLSPIVGGIIARTLKSHAVIFNRLLPIAQERCIERDAAKLGQKVPQHADCIQWIMETSPKNAPWTPQRVVHELMAIWFGSVHAVSTTVTFAIHDLCLHPEYVAPLREECKAQYADFERVGTGLPLLDSFIKESARLTPVESQSTRRSALQPFSLKDGTHVNVGDWFCTPVRAIMTNPIDYPEANTFSGFRFADPALVASLETQHASFDVMQKKPTKLTDVDMTFHVWGTGRMACPGRFYASAVMKVILGQVLLNYDCELVDPDAKRLFTWRSTILPKPSAKVVFTPIGEGRE